VREVNEEVKVLSNKKNVTADPLEDKLALFRQQVDIPLPQHFEIEQCQVKFFGNQFILVQIYFYYGV
jgi:hypothetical protein